MSWAVSRKPATSRRARGELRLLPSTSVTRTNSSIRPSGVSLPAAATTTVLWILLTPRSAVVMTPVVVLTAEKLADVTVTAPPAVGGPTYFRVPLVPTRRTIAAAWAAVTVTLVLPL